MQACHLSDLLPLILPLMHCCSAFRGGLHYSPHCVQLHCALSSSSTSRHGALLGTVRLPLADGPPGSVQGPGKLVCGASMLLCVCYLLCL